MSFVWFVLFSTIEAFAIFIAMFCVFRFGYRLFLREAFIASFLISVLSHAMRIEMDLANYFPLISLALYTFFTYLIVRVPPFWAVVMSIVASIGSLVIQTLVLLILTPINLLNFDEVQSYGTDAYILQSITSIIYMILGISLYKRGYGFSFPFDRFSCKGENMIMLTVIMISFIVLSWIFIMKSLVYASIIGTLSLAFLLYLAFRKERTAA